MLIMEVGTLQPQVVALEDNGKMNGSRGKMNPHSPLDLSQKAKK